MFEICTYVENNILCWNSSSHIWTWTLHRAYNLIQSINVLRFTLPKFLPMSQFKVKSILNNISEKCTCVCVLTAIKTMLYYSCYFFNLCMDYLWLEHSLDYALYHVFYLKNKLFTLTLSCCVWVFDRNLALYYETFETDRTFSNVSRTDLNKNLNINLRCLYIFHVWYKENLKSLQII